MRPLLISAMTGRLMLSKASTLMDLALRAWVPAMTLPAKTICTPFEQGSAAYKMLSCRFALASVISKPMGFWAPVSTMGFSVFWII